MVNWKKEGYEVGKEVYIVEHLGFSDREAHKTGTVVYAGTKNMKVSIIEGEKEKILQFNGKRSANGFCFGFYYCVYKSKEEYEQLIADKEKAKELREYISKNLNKVSLKDLETLKEVLDKQLA